MIDPNNIIDYNRTDAELEELILFLVCVAGKKASTVSRQLDSWINNGGVRANPFALIMIRDYKPIGQLETSLMRTLKEVGFGQYTKIEKAFRQLAHSDLNLRTCTLEDLMKIHGIGRKSASCFLAWTRPNVKVAMLDTHALKYLRYVQKTGDFNLTGQVKEDTEVIRVLGKYRDIIIPDATPSSKKLYDVIEQFYLTICLMLHKNPTQWDLHIWKFYSNRNDKTSSIKQIPRNLEAQGA